MDNIASDAHVACTIFPTNQDGDVFGAYMTGTAGFVTEEHKAQARDIYYDRVYPDDPDHKKRRAGSYYNDPTWHLVKVTPSGLWYFDTRYFEENRVAVPDEVWRTA